MTGMKEGAGDDPFADDPVEEQTRETNAEAGTTTTDTIEPSRNRQQQPYIIRRAVQNESVQWERPERLTFFVHRDVADGERDLIAEMERTLGRDVPKFDIREAVYRAALENQEDVLDELLEMGYKRPE